MILYRPHIAQIVSPSGRIQEAVHAHDWPTAGVAVSCQISPQTPSATFREWGVEIAEPYVMHCDPDVSVQPGDRVVWGNNAYMVVTVQTAAAGLCDHTRVLLERTR